MPREPAWERQRQRCQQVSVCARSSLCVPSSASAARSPSGLLALLTHSDPGLPPVLGRDLTRGGCEDIMALPRLPSTSVLVLASHSSSQTLASTFLCNFMCPPALGGLGDFPLFPVKRLSLDLYFPETPQGCPGQFLCCNAHRGSASRTEPE